MTDPRPCEKCAHVSFYPHHLTFTVCNEPSIVRQLGGTRATSIVRGTLCHDGIKFKEKSDESNQADGH